MGISAKELKAALRKRHALEKGWLYAEEVDFIPNRFWSVDLRTRYRAQRPSGVYSCRIDAYAMAIWVHLSFERIAYEIKVSRNDFLRELRTPGKRFLAMEFSNSFYFVMPEGIATVDEVPKECGLMVYKNGKLRIRKRSPWTEVTEWPIGVIANLGRKWAEGGRIV